MPAEIAFRGEQLVSSSAVFRSLGGKEHFHILGLFALGNPTFFGDLASAADSERAGGNGIGDDGTCADVGVRGDLDGRDQRGVAADKGIVADHSFVFGHAVVIAGDGACADVGFFADVGVAQIGQVVGLGAFAELGLFQLFKVADARVGADHVIAAQAGEGTDLRAFTDGRFGNHGEGADHDAIGELRIADDGASADRAIFA